MKLKNIKLLTIALTVLLSSCGTPSITDTSNDTDSDTTSESSPDTTTDTSAGTSSDISSDTSDDTSSDSSSDGTTTEPDSLSIEAIRVLSLACESFADDDGVGTSTQLVEFTGKLLARLDAITTQRNYGNRYKLLFVDSTGYIYVKVDLNTYNKVENSIGNSYRIVGFPSIYVGEAEVVLHSYSSITAIDVDLSLLSEEVANIKAIHDYAASLRLNSKGVAFSKLVTFNAVCLGSADNSVVLFADAENAIYLHGNRYIGSQFTNGASYRLTVVITMFNFRPGVEFIERSSIANMEIELSDETITGNELYNYSYEVDENDYYPNYSSKFTKLFVHIGYANYYYKDGNKYIVLEDNYNTNVYSTYQGARTAKTIFLKNEDCVGLYGDYEYEQCPFSEFISEEPIQIMTVFMPYMWNTLDYWQGYYLSISRVNEK